MSVNGFSLASSASPIEVVRGTLKRLHLVMGDKRPVLSMGLAFFICPDA